ncbi:MAG: hypothetical protein ABUL61_00580, partial [Oleiharenicola lentus]
LQDCVSQLLIIVNGRANAALAPAPVDGKPVVTPKLHRAPSTKASVPAGGDDFFKDPAAGLPAASAHSQTASSHGHR